MKLEGLPKTPKTEADLRFEDLQMYDSSIRDLERRKEEIQQQIGQIDDEALTAQPGLKTVPAALFDEIKQIERDILKIKDSMRNAQGN
jgi:peptidoglycan hydrolase CwlO-like protein